MIPIPEPAAPPAWVREAATLPLGFAQVREDPRLDVEIAAGLPPDAIVVMIASGGDTAVRLGRLPLRRLHLVDANPAQLALTRCKWHLAGHAAAAAAASVLGHQPMPGHQRKAHLDHLFELLGLPAGVLGPPDYVADHGPDHVGRYERVFAEIRRRLALQRTGLMAVLNTENPREAVGHVGPGTPLGTALESALGAAMALPHLVCLFGAEATQNPRRPFPEHFARRIRGVLGRIPARTNPFLWQILAGCFPPGHPYDWLQPDAGCGRPLRAEAVYHLGKMDEVLAALPRASVDMIHLSNILDWLSPAQAQTLMRNVGQALKPGGRVILRQLNSILDVEDLGCDLEWDRSMGAAFEARDRSFFYPGILVGTRP